MKDFVGYTKVETYLIEQAIDNFNKWNADWWDTLQDYRQELVDKFDKKPFNKLLSYIGIKESETYKVNSFSGLMAHEYWSVLKVVPDEVFDEFKEYYNKDFASVARGLRSLIVVGDGDPYVSAEGCNFIRRFTDQEDI